MPKTIMIQHLGPNLVQKYSTSYTSKIKKQDKIKTKHMNWIALQKNFLVYTNIHLKDPIRSQLKQ